MDWPLSSLAPTIAEVCWQRAPYLWLLATANPFLSWREVAEQAPGLIPPEHRRRYKWGTAWYEVWGIGIRNSIQRLCLRETLPFPYRMK